MLRRLYLGRGTDRADPAVCQTALPLHLKLRPHHGPDLAVAGGQLSRPGHPRVRRTVSTNGRRVPGTPARIVTRGRQGSYLTDVKAGGSFTESLNSFNEWGMNSMSRFVLLTFLSSFYVCMENNIFVIQKRIFFRHAGFPGKRLVC